MTFRTMATILVLAMLPVIVGDSFAEQPPAESLPASQQADVHDAARHTGPACFAVDPFFADEVWAKVGETTCLKCHRAEGDAEDSSFILQPTASNRNRRAEILAANQAAFVRMAKQEEDGAARLLAKVTGGLDHGGGEVLEAESTHYKILSRFVERVRQPAPTAEELAEIDATALPFFDGVAMISPTRLLRRVTLSLCGRLPTDEERLRVEAEGMAALEPILDQLMTEDAFYDRLHEAFNDIFLLRGCVDNPETILSYDHFKTRLWPNDYDYGSELSEKEKTQARYKMYDHYREAMQREPYELIEYIVRNERPFTELVTADYIMMSPHTARGYGMYEELKDKFDDPDDPYEFIPTKIPALTARNGKVQQSDDGFYPHAGLLSTFHYTRRYPTTDTNRNRLRARMYYQHFLGIDVMQLAPRVSDAAAIDAKYEIPTMQAAECVVCHKTIDPLAGLFQDYGDEGYFKSRQEDWYEDMFGPGREGEDRSDNDRWRSLVWLGERTASDPRFATAMVEHVYYILMGRNVLPAPQDIEDPQFTAKRHAYVAQRDMIDAVTERFVASGYNFKEAVKGMIFTEFYRADGLATSNLSPERQAQLDDIGLARLLSPEQLERKLLAVFGRPWGRLKKDYTKIDILYGGIDSKEVTQRMADPSGAMGAIQRMMASEVACKNVAYEFSIPAEERVLFPSIEPDVLPATDAASEEKIREAIVHLHRRILGREHTVEHAEVERTYRLFEGIVTEANAQGGFEKREIYHCRGRDDQRLDDPNYTIRGWRAVVTYLLRQHDFLYE